MIKYFILITSLFFLFSCDDDNGEKPEVIEKLRPIGVSLEPSIAVPGSLQTIYFHLLAPNNFSEPLSFKVKSPQALFPILSMNVDSTSLLRVDNSSLSKLSYYKIKAEFLVPSELSESLTKKSPNLYMTYLIEVSSSSEKKGIEGQIPVFSTTDKIHEQVASRDLSVAIDINATSIASGLETDLKGQILNKFYLDKDKFYVSWFISGGEITENKNSIETKWKTPSKEDQSVDIILTARGRYSKEFAVVFKTLSLN